MKKTRNKKRNNNHLVEITRDINCIPKGIYKADSINEDGISVSIRRKVFISVILPQPGDIKLIPPTTRNFLRRMSLQSFLKRYYELLEVQGDMQTHQVPFTVCLLDPSVAMEAQ